MRLLAPTAAPLPSSATSAGAATAAPAPKLLITSALFAQVRELLGRKWSPEQIALYLKRQFPHDPSVHVSHETIYNVIYAQPRGELRRELISLPAPCACQAYAAHPR